MTRPDNEMITEQQVEAALTSARNVVDRVFPFRADEAMDDRTALRGISLRLAYGTLVNPECRRDTPAPGRTEGPQA